MSPASAQPQPHSHPCPAWLGGLLDNPLRRLLQDPRTILAGRVRPGQRAADIGAGSGFFAVPLGQLVGPSGRVYAVDFQPEMLDQIDRKAAQHNVRNVVTGCSDGSAFTLPAPVDFILVFWTLHEVADPAQLVDAVRAALTEHGTVLFAEPKFHVPQAVFQQEAALFTAAGFRIRETPTIRASRSLLFERA